MSNVRGCNFANGSRIRTGFTRKFTGHQRGHQRTMKALFVEQTDGAPGKVQDMPQICPANSRLTGLLPSASRHRSEPVAPCSAPAHQDLGCLPQPSRSVHSAEPVSRDRPLHPSWRRRRRNRPVRIHPRPRLPMVWQTSRPRPRSRLGLQPAWSRDPRSICHPRSQQGCALWHTE